ncbi:MAG: family oligopeptide transporter [Myxococcaceae bacterium]|nr:family oligopeptide transporter [Myxococcaceae bacterium]
MSIGASAPTPAPRELELTFRAVVAGCVLGIVLATANVYTGLKTGFLDGGNITASVLAFAWFRSAKQRYSVLENNVTQTIAASAAVMSIVMGVGGPIPALSLLGHSASAGMLIVWGLALGALGVVIALLLRPQLIIAERLPFPTGTATAEVILALATAAATALRRARTLLIAATLAGLVGWLRDSPWALLPQAWLLPGALWGVSLASLSVGVAVSPLLLSTGLLIGARAAGSMLLGSVLAWGLVAPLLVTRGIVAAADHGPLLEWLMWPGAALMLSSSLTSLALEWRSLARGVRDMHALATRSRSREGTAQTNSGVRPVLALTLACVVIVVAVARAAFDLSPVTSLLALALSIVLASVCARSAGETDVAPVGAMGGVTQLALGGSGSIASLTSGAIVAGTATQTAQTLWAFKTGERLEASLKAQVVSSLIGVLVGALVVVPVYEVVVRVYGIGTAQMPAPAVMSWKATAEAVQGGLAALPQHALTAGLLASLFGVVVTLLMQTRFTRFLLSPVALGIGVLTPISLSVTVLVGGLLLLLLQKRHPVWSEEHVTSLAGGAIAGESLFAVLLAALIASGALGG